MPWRKDGLREMALRIHRGYREHPRVAALARTG